jgi:hypothetical protein
MNLFTLIPSLKAAWASYLGCRKQLWWPLSFMLLTPLAVLIVFGVLIPLGLERIGLINFNYRIINGIYLLLVACAIYCALIPFLDGLYRVIMGYVQGKYVDADTGFQNLLDSKDMGKALGPVILILCLLLGIGNYFKPLSLVTLIAYACTVFTPILCLSNPLRSWKKSLESFYFCLNNKKLARDIWGIRFLIILSFVVPIKVIMMLGDHPVLHLLAILVGIPLLIFSIVIFLPFYFFYPAYVYMQLPKM